MRRGRRRVLIETILNFCLLPFPISFFLTHTLCSDSSSLRNLMEANENYMESSSLPNSTSTDSTFLNPGAEDAQERASSPSPYSAGQADAVTPTRYPSSSTDLVKGAGSGLNASSPRMSKKRSNRPHSELMEATTLGDKNPLTRRSMSCVCVCVCVYWCCHMNWGHMCHVHGLGVRAKCGMIV